jgi:hypothetical protein
MANQILISELPDETIETIKETIKFLVKRKAADAADNIEDITLPENGTACVTFKTSQGKDTDSIPVSDALLL